MRHADGQLLPWATILADMPQSFKDAAGCHNRWTFTTQQVLPSIQTAIVSAKFGSVAFTLEAQIYYGLASDTISICNRMLMLSIACNRLCLGSLSAKQRTTP